MTVTANPLTGRTRGANAGAPRILYVTTFWPHRASFGAELRSRQVLRALEQVGRVEVVVLGDDDSGEVGLARAVVVSGAVSGFRLEPHPNRGVTGKLQWLLNPRKSFPHGCGLSAESARRLRESAGEFDLVWFFKLRTADLFPDAAWPRSVIDIDDVPSTFERMEAANATGMKSRIHARLRAWSWRRREQRLGDRFDVLGVCSEGDRKYLRGLGTRAPVHVLPNGTARPVRPPQPAPMQPPRLGFIGLLDYPANHDGISWFVRECWPRIKARVPDARLRLVGRGTDGPLKPTGPDIDGLGFVPDVNDEIATWSGSVVPIRLGAGTRIKIAQGFAQKCPLVSTTLGAYGYGAVNGRELFLADDPAGFADACIRVIQHPLEARQMAERAWEVFLAKWTWEAIAPRIHTAAEECLRLNTRR